jgi:hypothetical protein
MFTYFAFDAARLDCGQLHDVLYLIYWGWTDPQAAEIARKQSVKTISGSVRQLLASRLREISCNGIHSLEKLLLEVTPRCPSGILLIAAQLYSIVLGPKPCLQNRTPEQVLPAPLVVFCLFGKLLTYIRRSNFEPYRSVESDL